MKRALYAFLINWHQASDKELPLWLKKACAADPSLQKERESGETLTRALSEKSDPNEDIGYGSMKNRVMRRIAEEEQLAGAESRAEGRWSGHWRGAAFAVAAALVVAFFLNEWRGPEGQLAQENQTDSAATEGVAVAPAAGIGKIGAEIKELRNPLNQEIEYVLSDAQDALDYLKASFVPSNYLGSKANGDDQARSDRSARPGDMGKV